MFPIPTLRLVRTASTTTCRASFVALALLGLTASSALAGGKKVKPPEYKQSEDVIQSVDAGAHTVTVATMTQEIAVGTGGKAPTKQGDPHTSKTATFTVNAFTEIEVNGAKSDLNGLHSGMKVNVTKGTDDSVASRISAH